ncbi:MULTISPECIES: NB-ARC domain-containing protein [unclassified Microcoleus]|uniref:NB-ARC domain-containing protein n=1 Tax=unclassified Microcoleus TaxID=2642155 RepID=UPI001DA14162|nr:MULTISPECIES: NB-ARC domain-containing protein [unclassified Microcoleus]TAE07378.1 MAG: NACHT domain-containing protein [Oscillatoriales cyanobacterium]MCC3415918.1 AAA family ATPase [Microcoleus sp. PH2017_02_FOX_O_A]MCC3427548.1 AAA family ATPase [Microcoleus sp. PH2017_01_SCD_O_A]MCC3440011.1 AAA family ATPase [Microcoleus sp. PH2017_05_CCC_O_A]MCC3494566.1 AAA family ATPase [Microcoleus sp. PH2017_16_JOR_D_A]
MTTPIPQNFVQTIAKERGVTDAELETVFMALDGQSTATIATKLGISDIAVRKRLGEVYKKFQIAGNGPGKLSELRHQLLFSYHTEEGSIDFSQGKGSLFKTPIGRRQEDWDQAPDVAVFYGRTEELTTLKQWIVSDNCRVVALLGLAGSGKTTLSVQLAKQVQHEFDFVIWRSLRSAPTASDFLTSLIQLFANQQKSALPLAEPSQAIDFNGKISRLVEYLRQQRCLIILDDFEAVLKPEELAGHYREGCEGYRDLIVRLCEVNHQSCFVLVSAEEPTEMALLAGEKVRFLKPAISEEIARDIFKEKGLSAQDREWEILLARYGGNLLAIKIVATTINEFFEGNVVKFLEATALFIEEHISNLLAQQFDRMSNSEQEISYWLAIAQSPISLASLREQMLVNSSLSDLVKNLDSLGRRFLIEKISESGQTVFRLKPLIVQYVSERLVEQIQAEVLETVKMQGIERMWLLKTHNLSRSVAQQKESKEARSRSIVELVKNRLQVLFLKTVGSEEPLNILTKVASGLEDKSMLEVGYARENLAQIILGIRR